MKTEVRGHPCIAVYSYIPRGEDNFGPLYDGREGKQERAWGQESLKRK